MKKTTVVIAGGGFAGLSAAMYFDKTPARREDVEGTLISREDFICSRRCYTKSLPGIFTTLQSGEFEFLKHFSDACRVELRKYSVA